MIVRNPDNPATDPATEHAKQGEARVAIVTGASRGIGKAIAIELAWAGYDVAIAARSVEPKDVTRWDGTIHQTAEEVRRAGRRALPVRLDLNNMDDVRHVVDETMKAFGRIDLMVNNATFIGRALYSSLTETRWEDLEQMVNINIRGVLLFHHMCVPIMIKQGGGIILNVTSNNALEDSPDLPGRGSTGIGYPVTKAASHRIASALAKEVRDHKIAVINLDPGHTFVTERMESAPTLGFDMSNTHSVWVPARAAAYLATCRNPLAFTGKCVVAKDFLRDNGLMTVDELATPWKGGKTTNWKPPQRPIP